ncbi:MAG: protein kinase [Victivallales bacterium]|nr:protein kinase [Victivallales bacterium]
MLKTNINKNMIGTGMSVGKKNKSDNSEFKILVIDDDPMILELVSEILKPQGYQVDLCESSGDALERLIDYKYNLMLIDSKLPGITGPELLKYTKEHHPSIEVIIITGNPELEEAVSTVKTGAFDYLSKPFTVQKLLKTVEKALVHQQQIIEGNLGEGARGLNSNSIMKSFPDYRVIQNLGSGSTGVVLLVEKAHKQYALKILRPSADWDADPESVNRFLREEKILGRIEHSNVIRIHESGVAGDEKIPYILMEYAEGKVLTYYIKERKLSLEQKIFIISQIASALVAVHKFGILHRDVKPGNVIIQEGFKVKLFDFGIAAVRDSSISSEHEIIGSPAYMAPEVFNHNHPVDNRSDIFSLGILSYELITGIKPFQGQTVDSMIEAIRTAKPIEPCKLVPELPTFVQDVLGCMLQKNPADRYASASDVLNHINSLGKNNVPAGFWGQLKNMMRLSAKVWS